MTGSLPRTAVPRETPVRVQKVDRFVVPIDGATSLAFVLDHLYVAHSLRERLAWPIHRASGGRALVNVVDASDLPHASRAAIARAICGTAGPATSWIVETDYATRASNRSVVFVFAENPRRPSLVIKCAPLPGGGASTSLTRERDALTVLRPMLPETLARTVPEVLAYDATDGWESLALTWRPGRSAYVYMHTRILPAAAVRAHFRNAARWLARFHEATCVSERPLRPAQLAQAMTRDDAAVRASGDAWFAKLCDACDAHPVHAVTSHGDYWARNVLFVHRGPLADIGGVVDWEHSCAGASPFDDLFHFAVTYGQSYPWSRYRRVNAVEAFRRTFLEENHVSREVRGCLRCYCRERQLDARLLASWFRWFLLARALRDGSKGGPWIRFDEMIAAASRSVFSG